MREQPVPDHEEVSLKVRLRGRQVRERPVPDLRQGAPSVQLRGRQVREQHVPDHGEAALCVQLRGRTVRDEAATTQACCGFCGGLGLGKCAGETETEEDAARSAACRCSARDGVCRDVLY